jgi:phenylpyruvate tautomerase PptA (4-oxalocrotonate tautomerase family)
MPLIEVKAFESRFDDDAKAALLIEKLTAALGEVYGQDLADETWVILQGYPPAHWGFAGTRRV